MSVLDVNPLNKNAGDTGNLFVPASNLGGLLAIDVRKRGHKVGIGAYGPMTIGGTLSGGVIVGQDGAGIYRGSGISGGGMSGGSAKRRGKKTQKKSVKIKKKGGSLTKTKKLKKLQMEKKKCLNKLKKMKV